MSTPSLPPTIVIVGPTGVGKTALSLHVADVVRSLRQVTVDSSASSPPPPHPVEVISMDSIQLYGPGMGISNASLKQEENPGRIKHYLLEVLDCLHGLDSETADEESSASASASAIADYIESCASYGSPPPSFAPSSSSPAAQSSSPLPSRFTVRTFVSGLSVLLPRIYSRSGVPVLCGGTIYYLFYWLFSSDDGADASLSDEESSSSPAPAPVSFPLSTSSDTSAYARLCSLDPSLASKLHPSNNRKVLAAISRLTSPPPPPLPPPPAPLLVLRLRCSRSELMARQESRITSMLKDGVLREVAVVKARLLSNSHRACPSFGAFQSIGYKELEPFVSSVFDLAAATEGADDADLHLPLVISVLHSVESAWPLAAPNPALPYDAALLESCVAGLLAATARYGKKQDKWLDNKLLPRIEDSLTFDEGRRAGMPDITVVELDVEDRGRWEDVKHAVSSLLAHYFGPSPSGDISVSSPATIVISPATRGVASTSPRVAGEKRSRPSPKLKGWEGFRTCETCEKACHGVTEWEAHHNSKMHKARSKALRSGKEQHIKEMKERYETKKEEDPGKDNMGASFPTAPPPKPAAPPEPESAPQLQLQQGQKKNAPNKNVYTTDADSVYSQGILSFGKQLQVHVQQSSAEETWPGGALWDTACVVSKYLEKIGSFRGLIPSASTGKDWRDANVLELGCGTAFNGICCGALGSRCTVVTDMDVVVERVAAQNVARNKDLYYSKQTGVRVHALPLFWGTDHFPQLDVCLDVFKSKTGTKFVDLIIAVDIAYQRPGLTPHFDLFIETILRATDQCCVGEERQAGGEEQRGAKRKGGVAKGKTGKEPAPAVPSDVIFLYGHRLRMESSQDLLSSIYDFFEDAAPVVTAEEIDEKAFRSFNENDKGGKNKAKGNKPNGSRITIHTLRRKRSEVGAEKDI